MSYFIQLLPWDSELMGCPVARLTLDQADAAETEQAVAECRAAGQQLVYVVVHPTDDNTNHAVRLSGAWLADRKVTFAMLLKPEYVTISPDPAIVLATEFTPDLEALAWQSGEHSRFRLDPRIPGGIFKLLYSQWLRNSLKRSIAQAVMVLKNADGESVGLLTLGEKNGIADIGLVAVDYTTRGHQVGQRLMAEARRRAATSGFLRLQVVTQGENVLACRFYEKCGFERVHEVYIYHLWLA